MPLPAWADATLSAVLMSFLSSVMAQYIQSLQEGVELEIDFMPLFQFALFAMVSTPPNFMWQDFLERTFPAYPPPPHPKKSDDPPPEPKLSVRNTVIKTVLDQTLGATVNTLFFSMFHRSLQAALADAPREPNVMKAISYWNQPGAIDFDRVNFGAVWQTTLDEFWSIYTAGLSLWPAVAVFNYTLVKDIQTRNLVGSMAGIVWGTYMSMVAAE